MDEALSAFNANEKIFVSNTDDRGKCCVGDIDMLTSGGISALVARATGLRENSVALHQRILREEGLIVTAGRGRGAASLGLNDAIMVLIACVASDEAQRAAEVTRKVYELPLANTSGGRVPGEPHVRVGRSFLNQLPTANVRKRRTFGQDICTVVNAIGDTSAFRMPTSKDLVTPPTGDQDYLNPFARIDIATELINGYYEVASASIVFGIKNVYEVAASYRPRKIVRHGDSVDDIPLSRANDLSLKRRALIGLPVIRRLARDVAAASDENVFHKMSKDMFRRPSDWPRA